MKFSDYKPTATQVSELKQTLKNRFEKNMHRHPKVMWLEIEEKLKKQPSLCNVLFAMESTEGEPDVVSIEKNNVMFVDCSKESPKGRRSLCYDHAALVARKENKPSGSADEMAKDMGVHILSESQYRALQEMESFDEKTSSWIQTPVDIRKLGGALFCDRRYNHVFTGHNGAESYYAARGFRACIKI